MVKPGDELLKHLTANWFNRVDGKAARSFQQTGGRVAPHAASQYILVENHEAVAKGKYQAVALGTPIFDYDKPASATHNDIVFNTDDLSNSTPNNWAVLQDPLQNRIGARARALVYGLTWVYLDNNTTEDFLTVGSGNVIEGSTSGKGLVHYVASTGYEYLALATIGTPAGSAATAARSIIQTPIGGIPARSGAVTGTATCTKYEIQTPSNNLVSLAQNIIVYNVWPIAIPGSFYCYATKEEGSDLYVVDFPGILNVRWLDPNLEQTLDGSNYINIDTAEACP